MTRTPLSLVVTTLDNAATLETCLASAGFADEILLVDSGSQDDTLAIASRHGARILTRPFAGYGPQKDWAIRQAAHDWVLLLDADEWLSPELAAEIQALRESGLDGGEELHGYRMPRRERLFWRYQHPRTRMNRFLRLFDRRHYRMSASTIHAAPEVSGRTAGLNGCLMHDGETGIAVKVARINAYSSGLVGDKLAAGSAFLRTRMLLYPPVFFLRLYLGKRMFLDGWAGLIHSLCGAFYVFLKYAKVYEARRQKTGS